MPCVLICDDHPVVRDAIAVCRQAIAPDCEVGVAAPARSALVALRHERQPHHLERGPLVAHRGAQRAAVERRGLH